MGLSSLAPPIEETTRYIDWAMHFAAIAAAQQARVPGAATHPLSELEGELKDASPTLYRSWKQLRDKYTAWVEFHKTIEASGGVDPTSSKQSELHVRVNTELEHARDSFVKALQTPNT
jgi:hypothetical protein